MQTGEKSDIAILVAEDDVFSQYYVYKVLGSCYSNVICVGNGLDAVEECRRNKKIKIVLMDIRMPLMDGYEAIKEIRSFNKEVIIIAQSANNEVSEYRKVIQLGGNAFLSKPYSRETLLEKINLCLQTPVIPLPQTQVKPS